MIRLGAISVLADRSFPSSELLGWFEGSERWSYVIRAEIYGTAASLGCQVRRLQLPRGQHCRGFRALQLWGDGQRRSNLVLARPVGIKASEPW
jgi:hypothetical protein